MTTRLETTTVVARALLATATLGLAQAAIAQTPSCPYPLGMNGQTGSCTLQTAPLLPLDPALQPKFVNELPQPIFYVPDTTTFPGFDYYEIQMAPVTQLPVAFPQPKAGSPAAPPGTQWLGLVDPATVGTAKVPGPMTPLYTPVWGYSQLNGGAAYPLNGLSTYPSMSFKATKGRPVKVKWVNNAPDNHLFCPSPLDSNSPCAIDRTLMGTLVRPGERVNQFGGPMQPDNAMVIHLHGGEIPPDSDGMAELWIGNARTSAAYSQAGGAFYKTPTQLVDSLGQAIAGATSNVDPPFIPPPGSGIPADGRTNGPDLPGTVPPGSIYQPGQLVRPTGNAIHYNYPMVQEAATIWYHDHALGKTRINVAAGPAGYFYVTDPAVERALLASGKLPPTGDCSNGGILAGTCYDVPIVLQDRSFNADGTINFPNGLGQPAPAGVVGWNPLQPGPNPTVHPQWVPEYFGDHAVINGAIWPRLTVEPRPYRFRLLDGSNARCWTLDLKAGPDPVTGLLQVSPNFVQIGTDQGYVAAPQTLNRVTLCPGERSDVVVDFSALAAGTTVNLTNSAPAPFPAGITPQSAKSPYAQLGRVMQFKVSKPLNPAFPAAPYVAPAALATVTPIATAGAPARQLVLNEVEDPVTLAPLRVQIDAKAFEDAVTETPRRGTTEVWQIVNTTVDAHPMHLHLVKYQVVSRQRFDVAGYKAATGLNTLATGGTFTKLPVAPYLMGQPRGPDPAEVGSWKDTAKAYPGEVLTIVATWDGKWRDRPAMTTDPITGAAVPDPTVPYFQAVTSGPYVWHCHIVDHEDNEMMRPTLVLP
jgi:FtsP/CotA-like multicopper oxidase with cupredoxin domain